MRLIARCLVWLISALVGFCLTIKLIDWIELQCLLYMYS